MAEASKCDRRCGLYNPPPGYLAAHEWAERMMQAHEQRQCPGCGLWTIWVRKRRATVPAPAPREEPR